MLKNPQRLLVLLAGLTLGASAFAGTNANAPCPCAKKSSAAEWLMVLSASQGKIVHENGKAVLELDDTHPKSLAFTDRPVRKAMYVDTTTIIQKWGKLFGTDQPNGALIHDALKPAQDGTIKPLAIELENPHLNKNNGISFDIVPIDKVTFPDQPLNNINLFVDDSGAFLLGT